MATVSPAQKKQLRGEKNCRTVQDLVDSKKKHTASASSDGQRLGADGRLVARTQALIDSVGHCTGGQRTFLSHPEIPGSDPGCSGKHFPTHQMLSCSYYSTYLNK